MIRFKLLLLIFETKIYKEIVFYIEEGVSPHL